MTDSSTKSSWKERTISWLIPTIVTATIAILAAGVQVQVRTNSQNVEYLMQELNKVRQERQQLNDQLFNERKNKDARPRQPGLSSHINVQTGRAA